jgi:hypothetical protein
VIVLVVVFVVPALTRSASPGLPLEPHVG